MYMGGQMVGGYVQQKWQWLWCRGSYSLRSTDDLGQLRHSNLVLLLVFCIVKEMRLLIYKHVPTGSLSQVLHSFGDASTLDWPMRLRIGVGVPRGLDFTMGFSRWLSTRTYPSRLFFSTRTMTPASSTLGSRSLSRGPVAAATVSWTANLGRLGMCSRILVHHGGIAQGDVYAFGVLMELITREETTGRRGRILGEFGGLG